MSEPETNEPQVDGRELDEDEEEESSSPPPQPIAAKAGLYFRVVRYILSAAMLLGGAYFLYDGFVGYPSHDAKVDQLMAQGNAATKAGKHDEEARLIEELHKIGPKQGDFQILLQKLIGFALIPLACAALWRWLHISRGEFRLEDDTVYVPGHPPVPLKHFVEMDEDRWDKKGIADADYELPDGNEGTITLDDFVYRQDGIDGIHDWIRATLDAKETASTAEERSV